jgi:predicted nucleotidyltransferase
MNQQVNKVIKSLKAALKKSFLDFKGLYLYGSQAVGKNNEQSDVDIVVIFEAIHREKRMLIWEIVSQLEYKYDINIDLHPMTNEEFERNSIFYSQVVNKGIFYEAA